MKISVVIPNYNGKALLEKNLPVVIRESGDAEIIIVDDASTDKSAAFISEKYKEVKLIRKNKNSGYSSTVNSGVENSSGDLIVLLNSDLFPKKNYLKPLLPYFNNREVFAVGMLHENIEGDKTVLRGRGLAAFTRGFLMHERGNPDKKDTYWVNGGAGIFRKSVWMELHGMREIYDPFYWEDIDLSFRAKKAGYKIFFEPASRVVHLQDSGAVRTKYPKSSIKRIAYRNQFLFVWLNYFPSLEFVSHIFWLPYHFLINREPEFYGGFIDALKKISQSDFSW